MNGIGERSLCVGVALDFLEKFSLPVNSLLSFRSLVESLLGYKLLISIASSLHIVAARHCLAIGIGLVLVLNLCNPLLWKWLAKVVVLTGEVDESVFC